MSIADNGCALVIDKKKLKAITNRPEGTKAWVEILFIVAVPGR
jgi:hypothetical protein